MHDEAERMTIFNALECAENYVTNCAPKTPASEVVVKTVTDTLAVTGGTDSGLWIVAVLAILAGLGLFAYNHLMRKERRDDDR